MRHIRRGNAVGGVGDTAVFVDIPSDGGGMRRELGQDVCRLEEVPTSPVESANHLRGSTFEPQRRF